jgi:hypothetical protein
VPEAIDSRGSWDAWCRLALNAIGMAAPHRKPTKKFVLTLLLVGEMVGV